MKSSVETFVSRTIERRPGARRIRRV